MSEPTSFRVKIPYLLDPRDDIDTYGGLIWELRDLSWHHYREWLRTLPPEERERKREFLALLENT